MSRRLKTPKCNAGKSMHIDHDYLLIRLENALRDLRLFSSFLAPYQGSDLIISRARKLEEAVEEVRKIHPPECPTVRKVNA